MGENVPDSNLLALAATYVDAPIFRLAAGKGVTSHYSLPARIYLGWTSPFHVNTALYVDGAPWTSEDPHVLAAANAMLVAVIVTGHPAVGRRVKLSAAQALSHAAMEIIRNEMAGNARTYHIFAADRAFAFAKAAAVSAQQLEPLDAGTERASKVDDDKGWEKFIVASPACKTDPPVTAKS